MSRDVLHGKSRCLSMWPALAHTVSSSIAVLMLIDCVLFLFAARDTETFNTTIPTIQLRHSFSMH